MKQLLLVLILFFTLNVFADTPGKKEMHDSKITFQNIAKFSTHTFYWSAGGIEQNNEQLKTDATKDMGATRGAPMEYSFWAINNTTKKSTDTISFHNYYSPDYVVIINDIKGDSILYKQVELSNKNSIVTETNTDEVADKTLIADAKKAKRNHYIKIGLFSALGLAALGGVVWFFRKRKKHTTITT